MTQAQRTAIDSLLRSHPITPGGTIEEQRAGFAAFMGSFRVPEKIRTSEVDLGGMRTLLIEPAGESRPGTILFFHGGSYIVGSPETQLALTAELVSRTGYRAFSPDYRLAPEHPFPAAPNDALAAYRALLHERVDPSTIVLAGDSAGGGLAITTLLMARDAGLPLPAGAVTFSAGLDQARTGKSMVEKAGVDPLFTREGLIQNGANYLGDADPRQPLLSPATFADPTGLPPLLMQVGTNELLLDDTIRFAERAREHGVDVILDVVAGVPHVFQAYAGTLDEADEALDRAALFLRQRLR